MTYTTIILQALANTIVSGAITLTTLYLIRNRIYEKIREIIVQTIREQIQTTLENPKETIQTLKPLINELINELMKEAGKTQGGDYIKIPFLGKIPAQIIQPLIEKLTRSNKKPKETNPFD